MYTTVEMLREWLRGMPADAKVHVWSNGEGMTVLWPGSYVEFRVME